MSSSDTDLHKLLKVLFQAHPWHGISPIDPNGPSGGYNSYIEIVPTDAVKYELDKPSGHLRLDRPQKYSSTCPSLYGFIPQTYCAERVAARCAERTGVQHIKGDEDPLDICVLTEKPFAHGNFITRVKPIGGFRMIDGLESDDKIIAVLESDLYYGQLQDLADCPQGIVDRLQHYFLAYKQSPNKATFAVRIAEIYGRAEAVEVIERSIQDYRTHFGSPEDRIAELRRLIHSPAEPFSASSP